MTDSSEGLGCEHCPLDSEYQTTILLQRILSKCVTHHTSRCRADLYQTNLLEHGHASTRDHLIPHTIFIDPQLGRVGMTETEARKQGRTIRVAKLPMTAVPRALETGEALLSQCCTNEMGGPLIG